MRMVHAQAVKLFEELRHPGPQEPDRGAGLFIGPVEIGVQHSVAPRLTLGIRAAGRRSHAESGCEQAAGAPEVAMRSSDLQVPEQQESQGPRAGVEGIVLLVREKLAKAEESNLVRRCRAQLGAPRGSRWHRVTRKQ